MSDNSIINRISLDYISDSYLSEGRVLFINISREELSRLEGGKKNCSYVAYQELEDLMRDEEVSYILAVDSRVIPDDRITPFEVVNSKSEIKCPWQKCIDDSVQYYLTLESADDIAIIGVIIPSFGINNPNKRIKIGGKYGSLS